MILVVALQLCFFLYTAWPFTTDDAFISWRYARHLSEGYGLRWDLLREPVEGYSNFFWVILVSLFIKLGLPVIFAVKFFSIFSLAASLYFLYQLSRTFLSPLLSTLPIYLFGHYNGVVWWAVSGLETSFFVALVLFINWQIVCSVGFGRFPSLPSCIYRPRAWAWSCIGLTLLAFTRFEGALWVLIVAVFFTCTLHHTYLRQHICSMLGIFLLLFALPYSIYFGWRLLYFHRMLPNSYVCKAMASGFQFELIVDYFRIAFPCLVMGLPYFFAGKDCRKLLLWLPSCVYVLCLYHASPNIAYYNRLFLPAFGLLSIVPVLGIQEFFGYFSWLSNKITMASVLVMIVFTGVFIPENQLQVIKTSVKQYQQRTEMRHSVALELNRKASTGARVLLSDAGIIPFFARKDIQFIDGLCLNNKKMAAMKIDHDKVSYAHFFQKNLKPEWILDTYYPKLQHGNELNDELHASGFYKEYQLVRVYLSHQFSYQAGTPQEQEVDFIYRLYRRKSTSLDYYV
jgi:hypothetical protein